MTAKPVSNKRAAGRAGEDDAAEYLAGRGYRVLYRNFRYGRYGEIDIIALAGGVVCFVEVKSRSGDAFGTPAEAVGYAKRNKILAVANHFLRVGGLGANKLRFDVVEVYYDKGDRAGDARKPVKIRHIENAFGES